MNRMIVNETSSALKIARTNRQALVFSQILAFIVSIISILVLGGWIFEIDFLKRIIPGYVMMNPASAVLFILLSAGLWLLQSDDARRVRIAQACGAIVLFGGLFKLFELFGWSGTAIDQILFRDHLFDMVTGKPNRMAPNAALNFFLLGAALLFFKVKTKRTYSFPAQYPAILVILTSFVAVIGYLYGVNSFYVFVSFNPMAIHTAVSFLLLSGGLLLSKPRQGIIREIFNHRPGGQTARRFFPLFVIIPVVLGWVRIYGEKRNFYGGEMGTALLIVAIIIVLSVIVLYNARLTNNAAVKLEQTEEALRESELKVHSIIQSANDAIVAADGRGNIISWNNGAERIFGYIEEEVLNKPLTILMPEIYRRAHRSKLGSHGDTGETGVIGKTVELHGLRKDLSEFPLELSLTSWTAGEEKYYGGIIRDITERKRAEQALEEAVKRERAMIDNALDVICTVDGEGRFVTVNPACFNMWGYQPEELIGSFYIDLVAPEDVLKTNEIAAKILSGEEVTDFENRYLHKEGTLINTRWTSHWSESEQLMFAVAHDITTNKKIEEALKISETMQRQLAKRQSSILDALPAHICLLDKEGNILEVNNEWKEFAVANGYSGVNYGVGSNYLETCERATGDCSDGAKEAADICRAVLAGDSTHYEMEYPCHSPTEKRWFKQTVSPLSEENSAGAVIMHINITERKQIEEELEQTRDAALESVRLKSEFLANMSHEIRTPMNGVIGMTELLLDSDLTGRQQEYTKTIETSADALLRIIDDILDFSKIEAGQLRFEKIDFDLLETVESTIEILTERAKSKGLELGSLIYSDVPTLLCGDPGRLRQILTNLIGNAVKFTENGEVTVNVRKQSDADKHVILRFEVTDTGIGISKQAQRHLFQAFVQADGSTTRKYGGTGLGLAISKQLAELMGGEIGIESEPGRGSTFWFTARFEKQPQQILAAQKPNDISLEDVRILIVDDNSINRKVFLKYAASWGMIAEQADSGAGALWQMRAAAAREEPFEIAILDLIMPEMDGFELARAIKADPSVCEARLILLPSYAKRGHGQTAAESGIAAYLQKPIRQSQLYNCLMTLLHRAMPEKCDEPSSPLITKYSLRELAGSQSKINAATTKIRILVVEDNVINREVALSQLKRLGYAAETVTNGRVAIERLEKSEYDLILMDCQMPEMDGFEATAEIRRRENGRKHTIIIAMTANALEGDREICLGAGMDDYLSKPVKIDVLEKKLEQWIVAENKSIDLPAPEPFSSPETDSSETIDLSVLHGFRDYQPPGEPDLVDQLIGLFEKDTGERLETLRRAQIEGDVITIEREAHCIKGSAGNIGASRLAGLCRELEQKTSQTGDLGILVSELRLEFKQVIEQLNTIRQTEKHS